MIRRLLGALLDKLARLAFGSDDQIVDHLHRTLCGDDMEPHYPDAPRIGDRVQIRPRVRREGTLVGGTLATVVNVLVIDKPGRREVGVVIDVGRRGLFLVALNEITVVRREATA